MLMMMTIGGRFREVVAAISLGGEEFLNRRRLLAAIFSSWRESLDRRLLAAVCRWGASSLRPLSASLGGSGTLALTLGSANSSLHRRISMSGVPGVL